MSRTAPERVLADVRDELAKLYDAGERTALLDMMQELLFAALQQANQLSARVVHLTQQLYGRRTERIHPNQLRLAFAELRRQQAEEPSKAEQAPGTNADAGSEAGSSGDNPMPPPKPKPKAKRRGRRPLPASLPREEVRLTPTPAQLATLAGPVSKLGEERSEVLEYEPARFKVIVYVREVWSSTTGQIVTAPAPHKVIDKGLAGPGLLTQVIISKYRDSLPLNRQVEMFERLGVKLARSTLVDWVADAALLFEPLAQRIMQLVMSSHVMQVDDTHLPVQDRSKPKNIKRGRLWALVGDHTYVAFQYTPDWRGESVARFLDARIGWMQVDGYAGYEQIFERGLAIEVGCWMHCRRYFVKAFDGGDLRAARPIELIGQMYKVEAASKQAGESHEQRFARRERQTEPLLAELEAWIDERVGAEPPDSPLAAAFTYATNQRAALRRPLCDGALELDNGDVERALRRPAMGRRNWLFAGSDEGAKRTAIVSTVLESAVRHGLDLRRYIHDVLVKISAGWPNRRLDELLPHRWRELHAQRPEGQRDESGGDGP
jgi:transposase